MKKIVEMIPTPSEDLESIMPPKNYLWTRNNMQNYGEHNTFAKNSWPIYICRYTANNCVETFQTLANVINLSLMANIYARNIKYFSFSASVSFTRY